MYTYTGDDAIVSITFGTQNACTGVVTWGSAQSLQGLWTNARMREQAEIIRSRAAGDTRFRKRAVAGDGSIEIEQLVPVTGFWYEEMSVTGIGSPVKVEIKPCSSFGVATTRYGVISSWEWSGAAGESQIERITIETDLDFIA